MEMLNMLNEDGEDVYGNEIVIEAVFSQLYPEKERQKYEG